MNILDQENSLSQSMFGGCCGCDKSKHSGGSELSGYDYELIRKLKSKLNIAIMFVIIFLIGFLAFIFLYIVYYTRFGNAFKDSTGAKINPFSDVAKCKLDSVKCPYSKI